MKGYHDIVGDEGFRVLEKEMEERIRMNYESSGFAFPLP